MNILERDLYFLVQAINSCITCTICKLSISVLEMYHYIIAHLKRKYGCSFHLRHDVSKAEKVTFVVRKYNYKHNIYIHDTYE